MLQEWRLGLEKNKTWLRLLDDWVWHGEDPRVRLQKYEDWVGELSRELVRETAGRYLATPNITTILLRPESGAGSQDVAAKPE